MILLLLLIFNFAFAECVHELIVLGSEIDLLENKFEVYIKNSENQYTHSSQFSSIKINTYAVQLTHKFTGDIQAYNKKYIEYYTYPRLNDYLKQKNSEINDIEYGISKIGKSIQGRNLYYIGPKEIDNNKTTIIMFGRHHGDEGTANWIIEGFFNKFLASSEFRSKYQLLLYPMINPDGAMAMTRHNANGLDLNRSWTKTSGLDEISIIHPHLENKIKYIKEIKIVLDMHGSFREDFVYRVDQNFWNLDFYNLQQSFINNLAVYDPWQRGNFVLSNGDPGMARIRMIEDHGFNTLTHETIRNIKKRSKRTKADLFKQGEAIVDALI